MDFFSESIRGCTFLAETFPVFWPNLGPEIYVAFHGSELVFKEVTSYSVPLVKDWGDVAKIRLDTENEYFRKIEELTQVALEKCPGRFLVGYTDLHGGLDSAAAWRDPQQLCMDLVEAPENVRRLCAWPRRTFSPSSIISTRCSRPTGNSRSLGWASRRSARCTFPVATLRP